MYFVVNSSCPSICQLLFHYSLFFWHPSNRGFRSTVNLWRQSNRTTNLWLRSKTANRWCPSNRTANRTAKFFSNRNRTANRTAKFFSNRNRTANHGLRCGAVQRCSTLVPVLARDVSVCIVTESSILPFITSLGLPDDNVWMKNQ